MGQPPTDVDGAFEWDEALEALRLLVHEAMSQDDIVASLRRERIRRVEVERALLGNETVVARVRAEQDRQLNSKAAEYGQARSARRNRRLPAREALWLLALTAAGAGFLSLIRASWPLMPFLLQVLAVAGVMSAIALSYQVALVKAPSLASWLVPERSILGFDETWGLRDRWSHALKMIVLPEIWLFIETRRERVYDNTLAVRCASSLYLDDDGHDLDGNGHDIVMTAATKKMLRILERSDSGVVALVGKRGVGKTTAIRCIKRGFLSGSDDPPLTVVASAPAQYEARDFVLHLHALLCKEVIHRIDSMLRPRAVADQLDTVAQARRVRQRRRRVRAGIGMGAVCTLLVGVLIGGSVLVGSSVPMFLNELRSFAMNAMTNPPSSLSEAMFNGPHVYTIAFLIIALAALCVFGAIVLAVIRLFRRILRGSTAGVLRYERDQLEVLKKIARQQLGRTRFLQTFTTGWSGKISTPLKGELGRSWSAQRAEQQLTHPEVVEEFRRLARLSSEVLRTTRACDHVVIAIDELDKIGQPDEAHKFINDIKGVFGVQGCLFLLSVSDDAITTFEQHGIAVRNAFDSAFTEVVSIGHFTLDESRRWLTHHMRDLPEQFCHLCHCLSGGLPRDLRRCAIEMFDITFDIYRPSLSTVTSGLVNSDLRRQLSALIDTACGLDAAPDVSRFIADLLAIQTITAPVELVERAVHLTQTHEAERPHALARLYSRSACLALFCATILEVFDDDLTQERLTNTDLARLAIAQRQTSIDSTVAWDLLASFRKEFGLAPLGSQPMD